ncbi:MAG: hypothetical protein KKF39_02600 [Nanoarchaeota archaeon]|nr:hypothetical protein [Nanoarchaeota archaeon]
MRPELEENFVKSPKFSKRTLKEKSKKLDYSKFSEPAFVAFAIVFLVGTIFSSSFVIAQSTGSFSSNSAVSVSYGDQYSYRPSFQSYYSGEQVSTYWPVLGDMETCEARQDLMLQVPLAGCSPPVVRSDLLAEQDVPVFCQVDAININPLVDISQIRSMNFRGQYPPEVAGSGFHPARAALRTNDILLGSPLVNNIGYVVVVLKRQPDESKLPDFVNVTLSAEIDYVTGNAYGIGKAEFILEPTNDRDWETEKLKQSFWNGRYFVRLEQVDENFADVSIYQGDKRVITTRVKKGETSKRIFVPGMYCRAGVQVAYDSYISAETKARIEVSSGQDSDVFDVYAGSSFLDGRCSVSRIEANEDGETGKVVGQCKGKKFELELKSKNLAVTDNSETIVVDNGEYEVTYSGGDYGVSLEDLKDENRKGIYYLDESNSLFKEVEGGVLILNFTGEYGGQVRADDKEWLYVLYQRLWNFKLAKLGRADGGNVTAADSYFNSAIDSYEEVADDYPGENQGLYGKEALVKGIGLAKKFGKDQTRIRLINKYLKNYPDGEYAYAYASELKQIREFDGSLAGQAIEFDDKARVIKLVSLTKPNTAANAELDIEKRKVVINLGEEQNITQGNRTFGRIRVDDLGVDEARLSAYCLENGTLSGRKRYTLRVDETLESDICDLDIELIKTNVEKVAKIRLIPSAEGTTTEANLTVGVGIEKRAIELTPNKVRQKIENLNKTIEKWEKIVDKLGKVVSGLKTACFATAALLTFKNFMTGLSGEALARQEVMRGDNGWTARCNGMVSRGEKGYDTLEQCYLGEAGPIDAEVAKTTAALNSVNTKINQIQNNPEFITDSGVFGKSVDTEKVRLALAQEIRSSCPDMEINMGDGVWKVNQEGETAKDVSVSDVVSENNVKNGLVTTDALRSILLNCELRKQGLTEGHQKNVDARMKDVAGMVNEQMEYNWDFEKAKDLEAQGYPTASFVGATNQRERSMQVIPITNQLREQTGLSDRNITHLAMVRANPTKAKIGEKEAKRFGGGVYFLGLSGDSQKGIYNVKGVSREGEATSFSQDDVADFADAYSIGNIKSVDRLSYRNKIIDSDKLCRYFETEPYRGMPAVVPFDYQEGWYAATRQNLPAFGGIGAFDASGRVTSFWLCNVGENGRIEINTGYGDDLCQQINLNTGQPLEMFPGLDQNKARDLVQRAQRAIEDAARQYGNKYITVAGERCQVGEPEVGVPGTQCQDFMSPKDCHLLFNVCDPVICPPSRCNLGGKYPVANVIQTGIIGSIFLCLPNIREGIVMPVCLTGIHAGIDALVSIMRNYRDCLQENLETGRMVGICDQIYSIYLCEFFWNQVAPFVNVIIPKLIELAYGQGVRGGAEYLSVMGAWQNMEGSINYFTQQYAVNSMQAFQARNVEEIGGQFCKAFISVKAPTAFKSLVEPDSPPQFHAWFDQKTFTSATVPATAQYKVFYHIYAGNDQGVHFNVYLRNPPQSGYYSVSPTVPVASGYVVSGEYASETKDFTAPEGYKELCVRINNDEECGFAQVSSSFAVNYLRDSWMKDEMANKNIQSEKDCISGSSDLRSVLQPNVQAGVGEFVSPEIYNRGVVRICSSKNPGSGTDAGRFVDVGYCDDPKIRCWIDQRSVENAITQSNIGLKNETLEVLEERLKETLQEQGLIYDDSTAVGEIQELKGALKALETSGNKEADAVVILAQADLILDKLFWNAHKAQVLIIKGDVNALVAGWLKAGEYVEADDACEIDSAARCLVQCNSDYPEEEVGPVCDEGKKCCRAFVGPLGGSVERFDLSGKTLSLGLLDQNGKRFVMLDGEKTLVSYNESENMIHVELYGSYGGVVNGKIKIEGLEEMTDPKNYAILQAIDGKTLVELGGGTPVGEVCTTDVFIASGDPDEVLSVDCSTILSLRTLKKNDEDSGMKVDTNGNVYALDVDNVMRAVLGNIGGILKAVDGIDYGKFGANAQKVQENVDILKDDKANELISSDGITHVQCKEEGVYFVVLGETQYVVYLFDNSKFSRKEEVLGNQEHMTNIYSNSQDGKIRIYGTNQVVVRGEGMKLGGIIEITNLDGLDERTKSFLQELNGKSFDTLSGVGVKCEKNCDAATGDVRELPIGEETVECKLSNPKWIDGNRNEFGNKAGVGDGVNMQVTASGDCKNKKLLFYVYEENSFPFPDTPVEGRTVSVISNTGTAYWETTKKEEFYFIVRFEGQAKKDGVESLRLEVNEKYSVEDLGTKYYFKESSKSGHLRDLYYFSDEGFGEYFNVFVSHSYEIKYDSWTDTLLGRLEGNKIDLSELESLYNLQLSSIRSHLDEINGKYVDFSDDVLIVVDSNPLDEVDQEKYELSRYRLSEDSPLFSDFCIFYDGQSTSICLVEIEEYLKIFRVDVVTSGSGGEEAGFVTEKRIIVFSSDEREEFEGRAVKKHLEFLDGKGIDLVNKKIVLRDDLGRDLYYRLELGGKINLDGVYTGLSMDISGNVYVEEGKLLRGIPLVANFESVSGRFRVLGDSRDRVTEDVQKHFDYFSKREVIDSDLRTGQGVLCIPREEGDCVVA